MEFEEKKLRKRKDKALSDGNKEQIAEACNHLGDFLNQSGKYIEAIQEYEQEALLYKTLGSDYVLKMAIAHRMMGEMYMLLSEFGNALKHINIYLKHSQNLGIKIEEQRAYATLGRAYLLQGQSSNDLSTSSTQLKNAEKAFIKSLLIVKDLSGQISKIELLDMQARLYLNIGVVKEHIGDFEEAVHFKEKAIKICQENDIFELLHLCYISLSLLYQVKKNNSSTALRYCNLALDVAERLPEKTKKICETLITKSELLIKEGDFQSAKKVLTKAYKLKTPNIDDKDTIEKNLKIVAAICYTLNTLMKTSLEDYSTRKKLYEKMGDGSCFLQSYNKAIVYYLQALECGQKSGDSTKEMIPIYVSLYQTYKDNKEYEKSLEYLWKEYEANKDVPTEAVLTLCNIAEICEIQSKSFWIIYEIYRNALQKCKEIEENIKYKKIVFLRLYQLSLKYHMNSVAEDVKDEANKENFNVEILNEEDDCDFEDLITEENTPDISKEICLDDLTDSNSEGEDYQKLRPVRKRGTVSLTIKRNNKGETQLHQACIAGNINLVRRLIDQGHNLNVRDHAGWLPLHEACNHGFTDIVELLLDKGGICTINDKGGTSCDGITPLHDACLNGYLDVIELLLEKGANSTLKTDFGDTALNCLDKWRCSVDLDCNEQIQYEKLRSQMAFQLSKIGEKQNSSFLTNSNNTIQISPHITKYLPNSRVRHFVNYSDANSNEMSSTLINNKNGMGNELFEIIEDNPASTGVVKECITNKINYDNLTSAKEEYKNVIANLKRPNRTVNILPETYDNIAQRKRGAFLDEDEVDDDWLEDDILSRKKRHKLNIDDKIYATHPSPSKRQEKSSKHTGNYCTLPTSHYEIDSDLSDKDSIIEKNAYDVLFDSKIKYKSKMPRTLSMSSNSSRKSSTVNRQSSLLQKGFCRFRSNSPLINDDYLENFINIEADSTTISAESPRKNEHTTIKISPHKSKQMISFKIKIEDELLLVPVEKTKINELNIKWLAEEVSRRYYNLIGLKPILRLMTADGFGFEETDYLNVALDENMISSKVVEWKISPLSERYEEMCNQSNQATDDVTKKVLEKSQISNILSLSDWDLTPNLSQPIFRAVLHQTTLRVLDISNNFIQNNGCKLLGKSLFTLKQLRTLNLQGNCISSEGLGYLIQAQSTSSHNQQLNELEILNLSFNPLGNRSLENLQKLCKISSKLNNLNLKSCNLTNIYEYDLSIEKLIEFNISFNNLTIESMNKILNTLNASKLEKLILNFTNIKNDCFGLKFYEYLLKSENIKLKQLEIGSCDLTDSDIYKIIKLLTKCTNLEIVNFSNNNKLTGASFKYVIENLTNVRKIILDECEHIIDISKFENLNLNNNNKYPDFISLTLNHNTISISQSFSNKLNFLTDLWYNCHGEKGQIFNKDNYVCLYINDKDL